MEIAMILTPFSVGLSGILLSVRTQYSRREQSDLGLKPLVVYIQYSVTLCNNFYNNVACSIMANS